jgi:hypothetical protein
MTLPPGASPRPWGVDARHPGPRSAPGAAGTAACCWRRPGTRAGCSTPSTAQPGRGPCGHSPGGRSALHGEPPMGNPQMNRSGLQGNDARARGIGNPYNEKLAGALGLHLLVGFMIGVLPVYFMIKLLLTVRAAGTWASAGPEPAPSPSSPSSAARSRRAAGAGLPAERLRAQHHALLSAAVSKVLRQCPRRRGSVQGAAQPRQCPDPSSECS